MTALVSVESVLLVVLLLLVAGLLRSNAEILRRLGPPGACPVNPGGFTRFSRFGRSSRFNCAVRPEQKPTWSSIPSSS